MDTLDSWQSLAHLAITLAVSTLRMAAAFLVMPIFTDEVVPLFLRVAIFASLALAVSSVHSVESIFTMPYGVVLALLAKEVLLGVLLGLFFSLFLWAFEAAGEIVDIQVGSAQAQIMDPVSGHEVTLFGEFLGRLANYVFMAAGGLMFFAGVLLKSYAVWPVDEPLPRLIRDALWSLSEHFASVFALIVALAAPFVIVCLLIDAGMGLINRFAERLNVFFLSNSIKSLVAVLLLLLVLPFFVERLIATLDVSVASSLDSVRSLLEQH